MSRGSGPEPDFLLTSWPPVIHQRLLYGISPTDPLTFGGVALLLACVAGAAALFPAVRASRLDPLSALRSL
jgi:ABC-type lipoprotein release transport system permease subunit